MPQQENVLDMRRISNSEVISWNTCERRYYYEYDLKLRPIKQADRLSIGVLGHEVLATYYQARKDGMAHDVAVKTARSRISHHLAFGSMYAMDVCSRVEVLLTPYWEIASRDNFEVIAVEQQYNIPLVDDFEFIMQLDLLVKDLSTGEVILLDHKFVYDFWNEDAMQLNPQFPKYIGALRYAGIPVTKAILNQIRTRSIKQPTMDQLFKRAPYKPSKAKVENAIREQVLASRRIFNHRSVPIEERKRTALRVLNKEVCKYCDVRSLCLSEFDGGDITYDIQNNYKVAEYGYNKGEDAALDDKM